MTTTTTSRKRDVRPQIGPFDVRLLDKAEERLRSYIAVDKETGCWIACCGGTGPDGNSQLMVDHVYLLGHRWAWLIWRDGMIPAGRSVMHNCARKRCVNPDHLRLSIDHNRPRPTAEEILRRNAEALRARVSKLTWQDVDAIRASDLSGSALAKHFGVSTHVISNVRVGATWVRRYGEG